MKYLLVLILFIIGCQLDHQVEQEGESTTVFLIRLQYIEEIKELCVEANLREDFESHSKYTQAIAQCTLDNIDLFDLKLDEIAGLENGLCDEDADLSGFEPEAQAAIVAICKDLE